MRRKLSKQIPFGFTQSEDDPKMLVPVDKEQEVITKAREYYSSNSASIRDLISWVHENTGRRLSPRGMSKVLNRGW